MTLEETLKYFITNLKTDTKGAYVSMDLYEQLKLDKNFEADSYISNEIMGYYNKDGKKIPVICDFTTIGRKKSDRYLLEDLGEKSFILK